MSKKKKKKRSSRSPGPTCEKMTVECAFCTGTGRDPYGILSKLSKCPVCNGCTRVEVAKPAYPCAYCRGRGKQRHNRLTCSACKGTGHVTVAGPTARCPECAGSGKTQGSDLPCTFCRGAGLIAEKSPEMAAVSAQEDSTVSQGCAGGVAPLED